MNSCKSVQPLISVISVILISFINLLQVAEGAPSCARLESFPGYTGILPSQIFTGYVTVDEAHGRRLFYYFVESERNPAEDPVLLWLSGGPGCSSFAGFIYEIGPFNFVATRDFGDVPKVQQNPHSWTKVSNIIFLDSPVGTGFSYSNTAEDYQTGDFKTASDVYRFFMKWFEEYPEFLSNPLYVGGDSYGGTFVPMVAREIVNGIKAGVQPILNFKGYLVGNGVTDDEFDGPAKIPFAHGMGLISDELYQAVEAACNGSYSNPSEAACISNLQEVNKNLERISPSNILEPLCFPLIQNAGLENQPESSKQLEASEQFLAARRKMSGNAWFAGSPALDELRSGLQDDPCSNAYMAGFSGIWANNPSVRKAIHAQTEEITGVWQDCVFDRFTYTRDVQGVVKYHLNLTRNGYRALIYSGDHDMIIPFIGTQAWIRSLGYVIIDEWRPWFVDDQVAGYTRAYDYNLTFATVKGAGHIAAGEKPRQSFIMFKKWISRKNL